MSGRDHVKREIDTLPDAVVDKILEFIAFQKFSLGLLDNDTDYLNSIPGMSESIQKGIETLLSECVPLREVWPDV